MNLHLPDESGLSVQHAVTRTVRDSAAMRDSLAAAVTPKDTTQQKTLYEYISYPIVQMITLPIEVVLVPVVRLAHFRVGELRAERAFRLAGERRPVQAVMLAGRTAE